MAPPRPCRPMFCGSAILENTTGTKLVCWIVFSFMRAPAVSQMSRTKLAWWLTQSNVVKVVIINSQRFHRFPAKHWPSISSQKPFDQSPNRLSIFMILGCLKAREIWIFKMWNDVLLNFDQRVGHLFVSVVLRLVWKSQTRTSSLTITDKLSALLSL